jgi:hypothetical protein
MSTPETHSAKRTLRGSCHCQFIKYTVALPQSQLDKATAGRCNCTICLKQGFTGIRLPKSDFTLLSPSSVAEVKDYRVNVEHDIHKYFCGNCGIHVFAEGAFPWKGQMVEFFQINVVTLDQPQEGLDLSQWKMIYVDGRNDNFEAVRGEKPFSGGVL